MKGFLRYFTFSLRVTALCLLIASASAAGYPLTVVDELGRQITLEESPTRIVSMMPSHTENVCALGACDLLVGVDQFSDYPAEVADVPHLGSAFSPNIEELVALEPDLVLVDEYSGLAATLESLGINAYAGTAQTYDEVFEKFELMGRILDREVEAAVLSGRVRGEIEAVAELVEDMTSPTVFFELDATPYSVGPGSYIDQLISFAGGENIIGEGFDEFPQVDPEFVVAADPQVIVLSDAPYGETLETVAARPGWSSIDAVVNGRVAELSSDEANALSRAGPRMGDAVLILARIFHPGRF